jgi:membrane protein implicated in regulation of membrane protease activity
MILLKEIFLYPLDLKTWVNNLNVYDTIFWVSFIGGFFICLFGYNLMMVSVKSNAEPIYFSKFKKKWNDSSQFSPFHLLIGTGFFGFFGIAFNEFGYNGHPLTPAVVGGFFSMIAAVFITYYMYNYRYSPDVVLNETESKVGTVIDIVPKNNMGLGEIAIPYNEFTFVFKCITNDHDDIAHGTQVKILQVEDNNETFLVTKYY